MLSVDLVELLLVGLWVLVWVEEKNRLLVKVSHLRYSQVIEDIVERPMIDQTYLSENPS